MGSGSDLESLLAPILLAPITVLAQPVGAQVAVTVAGVGPGVPEAAVLMAFDPLVFDPVHRVDDSRDRETGGVGVGLAIVNNAVESSGGSVRGWNRSPAGFAVELRLRSEAAGSDRVR